MRLIIVLLLIYQILFVFGQTVKNVRYLQHQTYILDVVGETVKGMEKHNWCNFKIPEFSDDIEFQVFGTNHTGTITYKNGFISSVQHVDVTSASIQQVWSWTADKTAGVVDFRGLMRLHDLTLGFDVEASLNDNLQRYTSKFTHRLISFAFSIKKNSLTEETTVTITGTHPKSTNKMTYLPNNQYTDYIGIFYDSNSTYNGIMSWGTDIIQPIAQDVVENVVPFPKICYDCA